MFLHHPNLQMMNYRIVQIGTHFQLLFIVLSMRAKKVLVFLSTKNVRPNICNKYDDFIVDTKQSHTTICVVDHHSDGTYGLRALKQKIFVDGLCYLLQEIYGIENKNINKVKCQFMLMGILHKLFLFEFSMNRQTSMRKVKIIQVNV